MPLVEKNDFETLVNNISYVHEVLQGYASKSVNQFLLRNWIFGYYIVEYEQNGEDRAKYGKNLMQEISDRLTHIKGLGFRQLYSCKDFYLIYPHFLQTVFAKLNYINCEDNKILQTVSAKLNYINPEDNKILWTAPAKLTEEVCNDWFFQKAEDKISDFQLPPELLLSQLSFICDIFIQFKQKHRLS
jgi:hypothetical protein